MSAPRRGVYWQAEEVTILLRTVRDRGHAWLLMASTGLPNRRVFRTVARALQRAGFHRTEAPLLDAAPWHPHGSHLKAPSRARRQKSPLVGTPCHQPEARLRLPELFQFYGRRPVEASQGPGPSGMAAAGHQPQQQHCNCFQLLAHMDRRMARMGRRLAAVEQLLQVLEQRQVAGDRSPPPPTEQPLVLSSGPGSGTQQAASSSTSGSTTPVPSDLEEASTVPASLPSSAPGAPPEAPQWGGPALHLAGLPSSSEDTP
uniref:Uncharacterized protein n=1 Tax=Sphaerodactylus townsendi TaxID=933632 RepID=A0ACB8FHU7_9SAUR